MNRDVRRFCTGLPAAFALVLSACGGGGGGDSSQNADARSALHASAQVTGLAGGALTLSINGQAVVVEGDGRYTLANNLHAGDALDLHIAQQPSAPHLGCRIGPLPTTMASANLNIAVTCLSIRENSDGLAASNIEIFNEYFTASDRQVSLYYTDALNAFYLRTRTVGQNWQPTINLLAGKNIQHLNTLREIKLNDDYLVTLSYKVDGRDYAAVVEITSDGNAKLHTLSNAAYYMKDIIATKNAEGKLALLYLAVDTDYQQEWLLSYGEDENFLITALTGVDKPDFIHSFGATKSFFFKFIDVNYYNVTTIGKLTERGDLSTKHITSATFNDHLSTQTNSGGLRFTYFNDEKEIWQNALLSDTEELTALSDVTERDPDGLLAVADWSFSYRLNNGDLVIGTKFYDNINSNNSTKHYTTTYYSRRTDQWHTSVKLDSLTAKNSSRDGGSLANGLLLSSSIINRLANDDTETIFQLDFINETGAASTWRSAPDVSNDGLSKEYCLATNNVDRALFAWQVKNYETATNSTEVYAMQWLDGEWTTAVKIGEALDYSARLFCGLNANNDGVVSWSRSQCLFCDISGNYNAHRFSSYIASEGYWSPQAEIISGYGIPWGAYIRPTKNGFILNWKDGTAMRKSDILPQ